MKFLLHPFKCIYGRATKTFHSGIIIPREISPIISLKTAKLWTSDPWYIKEPLKKHRCSNISLIRSHCQKGKLKLRAVKTLGGHSLKSQFAISAIRTSLSQSINFLSVQKKKVSKAVKKSLLFNIDPPTVVAKDGVPCWRYNTHCLLLSRQPG